MTLLDPTTARWLHTSDPGYWKFASAIEGLGYAPSEHLDWFQKQYFVKVYEEREYHGIGHILYILGGLDEFGGIQKHEPKLTPRQKNIMTVAAFFHDLEMEGSDPVTRSSEMAESYLSERGFKEDDIEEVKGLILATCPSRKIYLPDDEAIFRDTDWRILGAEPAVYNYYVASLMVEIGGCAEIFQEGRILFLEDVLERTKKGSDIFFTNFWSNKREEQARANIKRELAWRGA
jgi:predicted metal-dependent HD superfamily phosphohydrolase